MDVGAAALLAVELASSTRRAASGRRYTTAEHAVILSTYVTPSIGHLAIVADAMTLGLLPGRMPSHLVGHITAAESRLEHDESGIAFLSPEHAAHVYMTRLLELHT